MIILSLAIICTLVYVYTKPKSFRWLALMLLLCLLMNLSTISLVVCIHFETKKFHETHTELLAVCMGCSIAVFNFTTNCVQWLFSFKYWVISYEVPQKLFEAPRKSKESLYSRMNTVVVLVNFAACVWLGLSRAQVTFYDAKGSDEYLRALDQTEDSLDVVTICLFLSALVLADALRRLKQSFDKKHKLFMNTGLMALHICVLIVHIGVYSWSQFCFRQAIENPGNTDLLIRNEFSRIALFTSQSFVEAFLIYLFIKFTSPIEIQEVKA